MHTPRLIPTTSRTASIDELRGFALLGVFLANTQHFAGLYGASLETASRLGDVLDLLLRFCVDCFLEGKFYSIFAILFGFGCAALWSRNPQASARQLTRLAVLGALGAMHLTLLWFGDILLLYALVGLVHFSIRRKSERTRLRLAAAAVVVPVVMHCVFVLVMPEVVDGPDPKTLRHVLERNISNGGYLHRLDWNLREGWYLRAFDLIATGRPFKVLALFLLGQSAFEHRLHCPTPATRRFLSRLARVCLVIGIPCNLLLAGFMQTSWYERLHPLGILQTGIYAVGVPTLAIGYASLLMSALQPSHAPGIVRRSLAAAGRMTLTLYIMQSFVSILIYDSFAGAQFGRMGAAEAMLLALAVFVAQCIASRCWLERFATGPIEFLWRKLTSSALQLLRAPQARSNRRA